MNPGVVFGENIRTEKYKAHKNSDDFNLKQKKWLLAILLFFCVFVLSIRLFYLQIIRGGYYRGVSDNNRIRTQIIYAPRGIIFDRNGNPLVRNIPAFKQIIKKKCLNKANKRDNHLEEKKCDDEKVVILDKNEALAKIAKEEKNIFIDSLREYPYKERMTHVLGYVGQISQNELEYQKFEEYLPGESIGKTGIEQEYEKILHGKNGKQLFEVDAVGDKVRSLGKTDPLNGLDLKLTIDLKTQIVAYEAASEIKKGSVVVSTPDGQILAMVSKPSYDPNLFTLNTDYKNATDSAYKSVTSVLLDGDGQPLLNRAISGIYPPGSTFKLIVAAAGLEEKIIDKKYSVIDTGILNLGEFSFANWYYTEYGKKEQGPVDVVKAIARSNDIFFYKLAGLINIERLNDYSKKYALGRLTGIDLPEEAKGLLPSKKWKKDVLHEDWYLGDTYHFGIGQGYILTTPLQVNSFTQAIANDGKIYKPRLLKDRKPDLLAKDLISDSNLAIIKKGMIESCSNGGVAWPLYNLIVKNRGLKIDGQNFVSPPQSSISARQNDLRKITVACKTGTSQHGGEKTLPHAWITLFAPVKNPQIVVTVLNESSGEGSNKAAPVAKKILEAYFSNL